MLKQVSSRSPSVARAALSGLLVSITAGLLIAAALATLLDREILAMENVGYGIMIGHLLAVFPGAKSAAGKAGQMGQAAAAITAAGYYLVLLLVNGLFFGGGFTGMGVTALLVVLAAVGAVLTMGKGRRGSHRTRYKIPR